MGLIGEHGILQRKIQYAFSRLAFSRDFQFDAVAS